MVVIVIMMISIVITMATITMTITTESTPIALGGEVLKDHLYSIRQLCFQKQKE